MASSVTTLDTVGTGLLSRIKPTYYDFDPGDTNLTAIAKVDMRDFQTFACSFVRTIGVGALTLQIVANSDTTTTGEVIVRSATYTSGEPNSVGDYVSLEMDVDELAHIDADNRYVGAKVAVATGTDEGVIAYIRGDAKRPQLGLTADLIQS